jgi:hypothetical protein
MKSNLLNAVAAASLSLVLLPAVVRAEPPEGHIAGGQEEIVQPASLPPAGAHPFAMLSGSWSGGGMMDMTSEIHERIRCRANYNYGQTNSSLTLSIKCASDNYKFELTSNVVERGGAISGTWNEAAYGVSGSISGRVAGGRINAVAKGDSFTAALTVNTNGNRQSVTITPQATYIVNVQINMNKTVIAATPAAGAKPR